MRLVTRRAALLIGLAIILLANAVALLGVAYNRSGTPESRLTLTQRELAPSSRWGWRHQDESSLWLTLQWRVPLAAGKDRIPTWPSYYSGNPEWLDEAKLRELGFDLPQGEPQRRFYRYEQKKRVLLVLEMDGPAYRNALQQARDAVAEKHALVAAVPGKPELERALEDAVKALEREQNAHSRLFAVDAGLSAGVLRTRYPDRARHAIVPGWVYPVYQTNYQQAKGHWAGYVHDVQRQRINVPLAWRSVFERQASGASESGELPFGAVLAFGKRHEPWLLSVSTGQ